MTNVVLLGGNGYLGRNVTQKWLNEDSKAEFYVVSRSGKNQLTDSRIHNLKADVSSYEDVEKVLPEKIDYIVDFIGAPEKDPEKFKQINDIPVDVMLNIAQKYNVKKMGFIGGRLGPKNFIDGKKKIADKLKSSGIPTEVVSPTLVYGNGRKDSMTRWVPMLKFFGIFVKNLKPVDVNEVATEMVEKMTK